MRTSDRPTNHDAQPSDTVRRANPGGGHTSTGAPPPPPRSWPSYAAAAVAFTFAAVSFYWGLGGRAGLSTLGGPVEQMALARDPLIVTMVWVTGVLKVAGGLLALALVQAWGRRLPTRLLLSAAWASAGLLTAYGVLQVTSVGLSLLGVVGPSQPVDTTVLWWRLLLWEPWFLLWGVLLGLTAHNARSPAPTSEPVRPARATRPK